MNAPAADNAPRRAGRRWPWILAGALAVQAAGIIAMVTVASSDPSFAVEPDYYQRAVEWDSYAAQRQASRNLHWSASLTITPASTPAPTRGASGGERTVELSLTTAAGAALDGAQPSLELFHHAAAGARTNVALTPAPSRPGVYNAPAAFARAGVHEARLTVRRGPDLFLAHATFELNGAPLAVHLEDAK